MAWVPGEQRRAGHHNLVDQRDTGLDFFGGEAEDLSRSLNGSGCIALVIGNVQSNVCHDLSGSLHCRTDENDAAFGPGMAPLMASTPFSTSDETMVRFSVVLVT